ncbi:putative quinol monooxygenase [Methanobrevibacter sp.]|uniref:putative quinol monooxygenase n=1 Tax=Methanobrevibacter sp. TaxID=66852 RepID=UPI00257AE5F7|nr:putative quinol monooxygenase [Methanobrevibacter sp.]MBR2664960.1 antibiotic biosynthesis monooxygenase [Methanobrevibacter sp.]MBR3197722.1 antibiotic biosynthesis monooxygenase [Methanobrevibacter sp.]MBR6928252.1 antibiotic biosynthesis monooxygenase [Methanobrevibacter sp.]
MSFIVVLAKITPKKGCRDTIVEISKELIETTLSEEGNIEYQLLQSTDDDTLTFVEKWESPEALQKHMASPHFQSFGGESADFVENMEIQVLNADEVKL